MELIQDADGKVYERMGRGQVRLLPDAEVRAVGVSGYDALPAAALTSVQQLFQGGKSLFGARDQAEMDRLAAMQQGIGNQSPLMGGLGAAAPGLAVGGATLGFGAAPAIGSMAALGALENPDSPIQGAATAAALTALPFGIVPGVRAIGRSTQALAAKFGTPFGELNLGNPQLAMVGSGGGNVAGFPGGVAGDLAGAAGGLPQNMGFPVSRGLMLRNMGADQRLAREGAANGAVAPGLPIDEGAAPLTMSERVLAAAGAGGEGMPPGGALGGASSPLPGRGVRQMQGLWTGAEFDAAGLPIPNSARLLMDSMTPEQVQLAKRMKWFEDLRGAQPEVENNLRSHFNSMVGQELGLPARVQLTQEVRNGAHAMASRDINTIMQDAGDIVMAPNRLAGLQSLATDLGSNIKGAISNIVTDIKDSIARNGGMIGKEDFGTIQTRLDNMTMSAEPGMAMNAGKVLDAMHDALAGALAPGQRELLRNARYRYKLVSTLNEGKTVSALGDVNIPSFNNRWIKGVAPRFRGVDPLGRAGLSFEAVMNRQAHTGSTLQRIWAQAPGAAGRSAVPAALGAVGAGALNGLVGGLF